LIRIKEIYSNLDEERKGHVTIDNIKHKFTYGFTHKDIEKLFEIYDTNKDGVLEVSDFAKMILPPDYTIEGIEWFKIINLHITFIFIVCDLKFYKIPEIIF